MTTAGKHKSGVYWFPGRVQDDATPANLGAGASVTKYVALQDAVDSVNLRGTIVGGTIEVVVVDGAGTALSAPPECIIGVWPTAVTPISYTLAAMKEQEEYIWIRQFMEPAFNHAAASTSNIWKMAIKLSTKRRFAQRGMRLGIGIQNDDTTNAFGANAVLSVLLDLYMVLDA